MQQQAMWLQRPITCRFTTDCVVMIPPSLVNHLVACDMVTNCEHATKLNCIVIIVQTEDDYDSDSYYGSQENMYLPDEQPLVSDLFPLINNNHFFLLLAPVTLYHFHCFLSCDPLPFPLVIYNLFFADRGRRRQFR